MCFVVLFVVAVVIFPWEMQYKLPVDTYGSVINWIEKFGIEIAQLPSVTLECGSHSRNSPAF